jgi:hypothetical protein
MYSRYLGMEIPSAACISPVEEKARITPVGTFIRRMGRPPKANRTEPGQRSSLFGLAKVTSAAVVTVLALGLWSLNAKLSRLNIDDIPDRAERTAQPAPAAAVQQETPPPPEPTALALPPEPVSLDHSILLSLTPAPAASLGEEPQAAPEALSAQTQHGEATPAAE